MTLTRRSLLRRSALLAAAPVAARSLLASTSAAAAPSPTGTPSATPPGGRVYTPGGVSLTGKVVGGVRVLHLVAEPVDHEIVAGLVVKAWGYNGRVHGPTLELTEGEPTRVYVTNRLPAPTSVHWHGIVLPNGMDGVSGLTQAPIPPGQTFRYEFTPDRAGTFMYHPHYDEMTQIAVGMSGVIVVHPRGRRRPGRDVAMMLHAWHIPAGVSRPDPLAMSDFNVLTFNGKAFPATPPVVAATGERVRLHLCNLGPMDHHPIHIHGHVMRIIETDGGPVPASAQVPEVTVLVPTGSVRVVEFVADQRGDWPLHCHMTHHAMTQMGHAGPNLLGADVVAAERAIAREVPGYMAMGQLGMGGMGDMLDAGMPVPKNSAPMKGGHGPFGPIEMGSMFTLVKVRDGLVGNADPGWYAHPPGTVARAATAAELAADGITP